jgi:tetratricopeptide (TPR) repeat protein
LINAYYGMSTVCSRLKQRGEAEYHMAKFKKLMAEVMKNIRDGADVEDDLSNVRRNAVQTFVDSAMIYRRVGKLAEAAKLFERALELDDEHVRALRELAFIYLDTGRDTAVALQMAQKAVQIEPTAAHYYLLGRAYYKNDQSTQALAALKRATVLAPSNAQYRRAYQMILERR